MIIVFSGADNAGKSTQIDLLISSISKSGHSVYSIWSRGGYTPGFEFVKKTLRIILGKKAIPSGKDDNRDRLISNLLVSRLWLFLAMLDLLVLYAISIRIKSLFGRVVICDRYLGDTSIDFSLNFPNSNFEKMWMWKLLVAFSPKPDIGLLFNLPIEESIHRSRLKKEPFPDSKEVLVQRLKIYETSNLFTGKSWIKIDGLDSIEYSANIIKKKVFSKLNLTNAY